METLELRVRKVLDRLRDDSLLGGEDALELIGIDADDIVQLRLKGPCASCPSTLSLLLMAIDRAIRDQVPEIRFVELLP